MKRARSTALFAALLLSAGVHALVVSGGWFRLPQYKVDPPPLQAQLVPPPEPVAHPVQTPAASPARLPAKPRVIAPRLATAPPTVKSDAALPQVLPTPDPASLAEAPEAAEQAQAPEPATTVEPVVVAGAMPGTFVPEAPIIKTLPRRGRIAYAMNYYMSSLPTLIGRTVQTWETADNTYRIDSHSETVGLARLTRFGPRSYHSSGTVGERGLRPDRFTAQVVISGKADDSAARFDWNGSALQFGRATDQKSAPLPAGSQDLLSFMYQLALAPPSRGRVQMPITNGTRFDHYDIDVLEEEIIETPIGHLRTLPVKQVRRQGRESVEVWLATDYHYLPVLIRIIARDGSPGGEQVATEINIGEK